ncbi:hypothetical protein [Paraburkholderia sp.]|uniref:hypothetical protein n=1 Tax=Paraburkholderia sp. TaxID=1926495 RepID=UPI0039E31ECD
MTECDEIAEGMIEGYMAWRRRSLRANVMEAARDYVRSQMEGESHVMIDNVAYSLMSSLCPPTQKPEPRYADLGSW